uniref:Transducer of ERBB2, 1b n=1 Tax=Cyprinus carpio carpio TaxID=630221 RepID=A0A9J8BF77_CYPCA
MLTQPNWNNRVDYCLLGTEEEREARAFNERQRIRFSSSASTSGSPLNNAQTNSYAARNPSSAELHHFIPVQQTPAAASQHLRRGAGEAAEEEIRRTLVPRQAIQRIRVQVLYVDNSGENGSELDKEIRNSFNPEAQVFMPISDPVGVSSESSSPSPPPFGQSSAVSPSFMPRSAQPLTFTTASFAATKFGSTKMKNSGRNGGKVARSSPTNLGLNVNSLLKQKAISGSVHSLYGFGPGSASALSPNAKEFVFPSLQGPGSSSAAFPSENPLSPLHYSDAFDVFAAYGSVSDRSLVDGLNFSLSNMQYSNQQFQPVMAN